MFFFSILQEVRVGNLQFKITYNLLYTLDVGPLPVTVTYSDHQDDIFNFQDPGIPINLQNLPLASWEGAIHPIYTVTCIVFFEGSTTIYPKTPSNHHVTIRMTMKHLVSFVVFGHQESPGKTCVKRGVRSKDSKDFSTRRFGEGVCQVLVAPAPISTGPFQQVHWKQGICQFWGEYLTWLFFRFVKIWWDSTLERVTHPKI